MYNGRMYPTPRTRMPAPFATPPEHFNRRQSTEGFAGVTDTLTEIIRFAGTPDEIEVLCISTGGIAVTFARRDGSDPKLVRVLQNVAHVERGGGYDVVSGQRDSPGTSNVQVIGRWAARVPITPPAPAEASTPAEGAAS